MNAADILQVTPPGGQLWWILWFALAFVAVGVALTIYVRGEDGGGFIAIGAILGLIWVAIWSLGMMLSDERGWSEARVKALEKAGYSQIEVLDSEFTAVKDGQWVRGVLTEVNEGVPTEIQVTIIPPAPSE